LAKIHSGVSRDRTTREPGTAVSVFSVITAAELDPVQTRKPSGLVTPSWLLKLMGHAVMGVAMGLAFALILIVTDPSGISTLIADSGSQGMDVFFGALVVTFGVGATLTGVVFLMTEDH
jgi:hypothetical protein